MSGITDNYSFTYMEAGDQWGSSKVPAMAQEIDTALYARSQDIQQLAYDLYVTPVLTHDAAPKFGRPVEYVMAQQWADLGMTNWVTNGLSTACTSASTVTSASGIAWGDGHYLFYGGGESFQTYLTTPVIASTSASASGGSMPAFTWSYRVTAVNSVGESLPSTAVLAQTTSASSAMFIYWTPVANATSYKIYRTRSTSVATVTLLASGLTSASYLDMTADTGSATVVPVANTAGIPSTTFYLRAYGMLSNPLRYWSTTASSIGAALATVTTNASGNITAVNDVRILTPTLNLSAFYLGGDLLFDPDATYNIGELADHRPKDIFASRSVHAPGFYTTQHYTPTSGCGMVMDFNGGVGWLSANDYTGGAGGPMPIGVYSYQFSVYTGGDNRWIFANNGDFVGAVDNTYDIGRVATFRPRTVYAATSVIAPAITGTTVTGTTLVQSGNGSAGSPAHTFSSDPTSGMWLGGEGLLLFSAGGTFVAGFNTTSLRFGVDNTFDIGASVSTFRPRSVFVATSIVVGAPTGGDLGGGKINAKGVYDDNVLLTDHVFELAYTGDYAATEAKAPWWDGRIHSIADTERFTRERFHLPSLPSRDDWTSNGKRSLGEMVSALWETVERQQLHIFELNRRLESINAYRA